MSMGAAAVLLQVLDGVNDDVVFKSADDFGVGFGLDVLDGGWVSEHTAGVGRGDQRSKRVFDG